MPITPSPQGEEARRRYQAVLDYYISCRGVDKDLLGEKMSGECEKCSEHTLDCYCAKLMVSRIEHIGRARQALSRILKEDIFDHLSKYNAYWHSEHDEAADDKLDNIRMKLNCLNDNLWDVMRILAMEIDE